jgi:zinc D-Ala-D-Ala carboxypeptidase
MNLTSSFTLKELVHSTTAIRNGINNNAPPEVVRNLTYLCQHVLEPLREHMGCPIKVSSGYRSPELNKLVKGSKSSQHMEGKAADLVVHGRNQEMFMFILQYLPFDQLIWEFGTDGEPDWVHVSYNADGNKRQVLKAVKQNGKTKYLNYND